MNYDLANYEEAEKKAEKLGKKIVTPEADQLFIDIDTPEQLEVFSTRIQELNHLHNVMSTRQIPSPGGVGHYHIYVTLENDMDDTERVFLQLFLGSDPIREYLSLCLIQVGDPHPILFFEDK